MGNATRPIVASEQGNSQDVGHVLNDDPAQSTPQHFGNLIEIFFVPFGQDNGLDTRPKGGQRFFLKPANGQYSAAQRNLSARVEPKKVRHMPVTRLHLVIILDPLLQPPGLLADLQRRKPLERRRQLFPKVPIAV